MNAVTTHARRQVLRRVETAARRYRKAQANLEAAQTVLYDEIANGVDHATYMDVANAAGLSWHRIRQIVKERKR